MKEHPYYDSQSKKDSYTIAVICMIAIIGLIALLGLGNLFL